MSIESNIDKLSDQKSCADYMSLKTGLQDLHLGYFFLNSELTIQIIIDKLKFLTIYGKL